MKSKVSRSGHRIYATATGALASERSMRRISDDFKKAAEYEISGDLIKLKNIIETVRWRLSRIPEEETRRILIMGVKGNSTQSWQSFCQ